MIGAYATGLPEKQELLLFDQFATGTDNSRELLVSEEALESLPHAIRHQWLRERGLLIEVEDVIAHPPGWPDLDRSRREWFRAFKRLNAKYHGQPVSRIVDSLEWTRMQDGLSRLFASRLRLIEGLDAVPLAVATDIPPDMPAHREEVLRVVLKCLPVPGDDHSLDDVLDFKRELKSLGLMPALRSWAGEMGSGDLTGAEIADKIEYLASSFERTLTLEKMARRTTVVETIVVTTAEIAESLVRFRWSAAARALFDVRRRQIDLMKVEMAMPGREIAYIVKARERFVK